MLKIIFISICSFVIFIFLEGQSLLINSSLILANITHDMTHYIGDPVWVNRYNEAVWLSASGRYNEAKILLAPILNNTTISRKADVAELYGDLIYFTSGSLDDVSHMYERSLSFTLSDRVIRKLAYIQQSKESNTGSGKKATIPQESHAMGSGSLDLNAKRGELQQISQQRDQYLGNTASSQRAIQNELQKLIESTQSSGNTSITQDW